MSCKEREREQKGEPHTDLTHSLWLPLSLSGTNLRMYMCGLTLVRRSLLQRGKEGARGGDLITITHTIDY